MGIIANLLVELEKTAASTDVLSGTDLEVIPFDGKLIIYAASTVNTATLEITMPGHQSGKTLLLRKRTDGIPNIDQDPGIVLAVRKGQKVGLNLAGTTGTCHFTAILNP